MRFFFKRTIIEIQSDKVQVKKFVIFQQADIFNGLIYNQI